MHFPSEEESHFRFSRLKGNCRFYLSVPFEDTSEIRKERYPYIPLQGVNQEGVSKSHFCFAFYKMTKWKYAFANYLVLDVTIVYPLRF